MIDSSGRVVHELDVGLPQPEVFEFFTDALSPAGQGTRVRLVHDRLPGDLRVIHDEGWSGFLARLAAVAVGAEPPAYPTEAQP